MAALPDSSVVSLEEYLRTPYDPDVEFMALLWSVRVTGCIRWFRATSWLHSAGSIRT
jgi:hypothetical protein